MKRPVDFPWLGAILFFMLLCLITSLIIRGMFRIVELFWP